MIVKVGRIRLKQFLKEATAKRRTNTLHRWLVVNADDIASLRKKGDRWDWILDAAIDSGVVVSDRARALRQIRKHWSLLMKGQVAEIPPHGSLPPQETHEPPPSRMPSNWQPPIKTPPSGEKKDSSPPSGDVPFSRGRNRVAEMKEALKRAQRERDPGFRPD